MEDNFGHSELKDLIEKNNAVLAENNRLIKKLYKATVWGFWIRITWYVVLIGLPFALYFYILEPYFNALGSSYDVFSTGMQEIPGWKQFTEAMKHYRGE